MQYLQYLQMDEVKLNRSGRNFKKWKWNYAIRITHYHATIINLSTYRECTQDKLNMRLHGQLKYGLAVSFTQTHSAHFIPYVHLKTYSLKTQSAVKIYHATHYLNIFCKTDTLFSHRHNGRPAFRRHSYKQESSFTSSIFHLVLWTCQLDIGKVFNRTTYSHCIVNTLSLQLIIGYSCNALRNRICILRIVFSQLSVSIRTHPTIFRNIFL